MSDATLPFGAASLVIDESDSGYATPRFIAPLVDTYANLVLVVRFGNSSKVWQQAPPSTDKNKVGATAIYGKKTFYLQLASGNHTTTNGKTKQSVTKYRDAIYDIEAQQTLEINETTSKGRAFFT